MTSRWLLSLALGVPGALAAPAGPPLLPDPVLTPGDVLTTDAQVICRPGYSRTVRAVPQSLKDEVYREYGITSRAPGEFEVDHLISLELGGSNSLRNLWPQSYVTTPLNARVKDTLENRLHDLICAGKLAVPEAQRAIARNWQEAYVKYVGPLPGGAKPQRAPNQPAIPPTHVPTLPPGAADPEHPTLDLPILPGLPAPGTPEAAPAPDALPDMVLPTTAPPAGPDATSPTGPTPPDAQGGCPEDAPVKVSRSGVYHLPQGDANYAVTRAVACFPDGPSAEAAGYRAAR